MTYDEGRISGIKAFASTTSLFLYEKQSLKKDNNFEKTGRLDHLTCEMHVYRSKGSVMVKYLAFVKKGGGGGYIRLD